MDKIKPACKHPTTQPNNRLRAVVIVALSLLVCCNTLQAQGTAAAQRIYLQHADQLYANENYRPGLQVAKGNVHFIHRGAHLYCDSAHFRERENSFNAYGRVRFRQGDTLSLTANRVLYNGQSNMLQARGNVVLKHMKTTLYADSLDFDRRNNLAYYFEGGKLVDPDAQLVSDWGEYNTVTKQARFFYSVTLKKDNDYIETDSLLYNSATNIATVVGRSVIYTDRKTITTQRGYYNTHEEHTQLYSRSTIEDDNMTITADTMLSDKHTGIQQARGHVVYEGKKNKNRLLAGYCRYDSNLQAAFATDNPVAMEFSQNDTLWLHADTLRLKTFNADTDSLYREIYAYHRVRTYRQDVQAVADSAMYNTRDSLLKLITDPIAWSDNRQILGEQIHVYLADTTVRQVNILGQAMSIEQMNDGVHYNQVESKRMQAYFDEQGNMRRTDAIGNVKSIYYPLDDKDSSIIAVNYLEGDTIRLYIDTKRQLDRIWVSKPIGTAYPPTQVPPERTTLQAFAWYDYIRPTGPDDIYEWRSKHTQPPVRPRQPVGGAEDSADVGHPDDEQQPSQL